MYDNKQIRKHLAHLGGVYHELYYQRWETVYQDKAKAKMSKFLRISQAIPDEAVETRAIVHAPPVLVVAGSEAGAEAEAGGRTRTGNPVLHECEFVGDECPCCLVELGETLCCVTHKEGKHWLHSRCIGEWLLRSLTCPICMAPFYLL
jgi:hypothetical protein